MSSERKLKPTTQWLNVAQLRKYYGFAQGRDIPDVIDLPGGEYRRDHLNRDGMTWVWYE